MTNTSLAQSYLVKAKARLKMLAVLLEEAAYSDVVREAQEIVAMTEHGPPQDAAWARGHEGPWPSTMEGRAPSRLKQEL